ncbi:conserved hypothetical protein [Methylocella silvestris BL2]|uniref:pEK499-p136 HEPN domain-containing protein n=1 Tax=Methylocella silvestris (strain DSM 15510 / CIP 108128 / LMG 27833 / NCIMB 13906 / BL2) TaxID=395965 RepID=B8ENV4_METSB|nr:hypothetical protein [Methylocella silvestris]ACK50890.1 conserved hypothetical protein [Methylocella silvestris BL2]
MIPERFVTEYPARCGQLLDMLERPARHADLLGSFALLVASAAFTIPFGRMVEKAHPLGPPEDALYKAVEGLKKLPFADSPFWAGGKPGFFRYAKIVTDPEDTVGWLNEKGEHPLKSTEAKDANIVLRTIRNGLAHGNVVYLDKDGYETAGKRVVYLAFLSKHESGDGFRVAIFDEESFLAFLKGWIGRLQGFPLERKLAFAEAAE